jgi:uncharacterized protein YigA (DUF484 family)
MDGSAPPNDDTIAAWLRANPNFLSDRPELYREMAPPRRVHGEVLTDHMAAMILAERAASRDLAEATRAGEGFVARTHSAVLALFSSQDPAETVSQEWPALLGLEDCSLADEGIPAAHRRSLPRGTVRRLMPAGRDALVRADPTDLPLLHAEAAGLVRCDALARLPLPGPPAILVLGARSPADLPLRGAGPHLIFLAQAVAAALAR